MRSSDTATLEDNLLVYYKAKQSAAITLLGIYQMIWKIKST